MIWSPVPVPVTCPVEFPVGRHNPWYSLAGAQVTPKVPTENPYPKGGFSGFHIYKLIQYNCYALLGHDVGNPWVT